MRTAARMGLAATVANGVLYALGGFDGAKVVATNEVYAP